MLVGADYCVCVVFVWEETVVQGGNPPAQLGDHIYRITKIVPTLSSHASSSTLRAVIATLRLWSYNWATSFSIPHTENPATLARNITRSNLVLYNRPDCNEGETVIQ